jgi:hypothetical protein
MTEQVFFRSENVLKESKFISGYLGYKFILCKQSYCEVKSRIAMAKAAFSKKRALFTSKMDLELRKLSKILHLRCSFIWC